MNVVIDTYAWIEYFEGSKRGEKVQEILENSKIDAYTSTITILELTYHYLKKNFPFDEDKKIILSLSKISNINVENAEQAGELHFNIKKERKHFSMADTIILQLAKEINGKVVTGDEDFRGLKEVIMIK